MSVDKLRTRPFWCYNKKRKVILSRFTKKGYEEGASSFCYGALTELHKFKHNQVEHVNNMCHCYYTPLKGAVLFFCNENDVWGEIQAGISVLNRRIKIKCRKCGRRSFKILLNKCGHCDLEERA